MRHLHPSRIVSSFAWIRFAFNQLSVFCRLHLVATHLGYSASSDCPDPPPPAWCEYGTGNINLQKTGYFLKVDTMRQNELRHSILYWKKFFRSVKEWHLSTETVNAPVCCKSRSYSKWKLRSDTELTAISYHKNPTEILDCVIYNCSLFHCVFISKLDELTSTDT